MTLYDLTVFGRGNADRFFEQFRKINGVAYAYIRGNLRDGCVRFRKQKFRFFYAYEVEIADGADVKLFFELMQKITFVHEAHFCQAL